MSNKELPTSTEEKIKADAEKLYPLAASHTITDGPRAGYIAGATAENTRAQALVDALELIKRSLSGINDIVTNDVVSIAETSLQQWKGKDVEPVKEIEYMPVHPEDVRKPGCPKWFPMHLLNEGQAMRNHSQSLKRLKERGGLSVKEMLAVYYKKEYSYYGSLKWEQALSMLNEILTNPQQSK